MVALNQKIATILLDEQQDRQERRDRLFVSGLVDIARICLEREEYNIAEEFLDMAKDYNHGRYKKDIEAMNIHYIVMDAVREYGYERFLYAG